MPDWSYRTVFRPLLFRLPFPLARALCLGFMGGLSRLPLGGEVIDFLGHMRPDARLKTEIAGLCLPSPLVLGPFLDCRVIAPGALARFGFGMIEIGPVTVAELGNHGAISRRNERESLAVPDPLPSLALDDALRRLPQRLAVPVLVRLGAASLQQQPAENERVVAAFRDRAAAFGISLDQEDVRKYSLDEWNECVQTLVRVAAGGQRTPRPLLICLPADFDLDVASSYVAAAIAAGAAGIIVDGRARSAAGGWLVGRAALQESLATVRRLRERFGAGPGIFAGAADDPQTGLELLAAGANAVQIDAGLVYAGPGLPKRMNEAVLFARGSSNTKSMPTSETHAAAMSWFWALALGVAMLLGGLLALSFAATRVLLPYDEAYLGMSAEELSARMPRLLAFMAHDRVTLAGTMLAVGIQYICLAWYGIRRGLHWAKIAVVASAFAGFLSFFLFLGFGYFDPLHAFVTAILFQFLLLAFQGRLGTADSPMFPSLLNDWRWRLANWGQLLLIVQGAAIIAAGVTIAIVGITTVFVPEDLEFMGTTVAAIRATNPQLVPVVAHDRASFGGMLIAVGLATLLPALWGIRQGEQWLWWMLALAGTTAYAATLCVHLHVGYVDPMHLAPAFGGLALLWTALALLFPYLALPSLDHEAAWERLLRATAALDSAARRQVEACDDRTIDWKA